jgi:hypothetical protein
VAVASYSSLVMHEGEERAGAPTPIPDVFDLPQRLARVIITSREKRSDETAVGAPGVYRRDAKTAETSPRMGPDGKVRCWNE